MKKCCLILLTAVICCGVMMTSYAQGSGRTSRRSSKNAGKNAPVLSVPTDTINVEMSLQKPPVYTVDGKKVRVNAGGSGVPESFKQWLVNEISFGISYNPGKRTSTTALILEGVRVELYIYAPGPARDKASFRWLCGTQTLQCLIVEPEQRSRRFWASLFLPAAYVYRHFPQERGGKYAIRVLEGVVVITDRDRNVLGWRAFGYRTKQTVSRAKKLMDSVNELRSRKIQNVVLWPRENTPWMWLDADRFELPQTKLEEVPAAPAGKAVPAPASGEEKESEEDK